MLQRITNNFAALTIGGVALAWLFPPAFTWMTDGSIRVAGQPLLSLALGMIMLAMGLTLSFDDYRGLARMPRALLAGVALQFLVMPLSGFAVAKVLGLEPGLAVGLILVACCPGGTASNIVTYIARGHVALSVAMTMASTLAAVVLTPLLTGWLAGAYVEIDRLNLLVQMVSVVLVPVVAGTLLNRMFPRAAERVNAVLPLVAIAVALAVMSVPFPAPDRLVLTPQSLYTDQDVPVSLRRWPGYNASGSTSLYQGPMRGAGPLQFDGLSFLDVSPAVNSSVALSAWLDPRRYEHGTTNRYGGIVWMDDFTYFVNSSRPAPSRVSGPARLPAGGYGPVTYTWIADTVLHNTSSAHALPAFAGLLHNARLLADLPTATDARLRPSTHPIPAGVTVVTAARIALNLLSVMLLLVPFTFMPANAIAHVVHRREVGLDDVSYASLLTPTHYWISTFLWDMASFSVFAVLAWFVFVFFGRTDIFAGFRSVRA